MIRLQTTKSRKRCEPSPLVTAAPEGRRLSLPRTFDTRHKVVPALQIQFGIDDLERLQDRLRGTLRRPLSV